MSLTIDDLFTSPDHYLHSFDGDAAIFVPMDRAAYHRSIFLDARISPAADGTMRVGIPALAQRMPSVRPVAWIFHMAHCGSTLLARALDDVRAGLVLREPQALRQTALFRDRARLGIVLGMLGKRYRMDAPTLVKANVPVNFLLPELAETQADARAILLYLPLDAYLRAILRNAPHRNWLRNVTGQLAPYMGDLSHLADGPRAAALWLAQITAFIEALDRFPGARSLNAETFFLQPLPVLQAAARHLELPLSDATLASGVAGPLFSTYSKNPSLAFDNAARIARLIDAEQEMAADIAAAKEWIGRQHPTDDADAPLARMALIR